VFDTALADFDSLIMTQYQLVAAIARTPATKLLGTSPKGFNATGEHESDSYDQELVSIQAGGMTSLLDRHHLLLCRSEFSEYPGLSVSVEWNPVRALKPAEKADLNLKDAQAAQARVTAQIIAPDEERRRLVNDPDGDYAFLAGEEPEDELDLEGLDLPEDGDDEAGEIGDLSASMDADFDESKVKRAKDGKFGQGGVSGDTPKEEKQRKIDSVKIDFSRDNKLPGLNAEDLAKMGGKADKPLLLKKQTLEKNARDHPDIQQGEYARIIGTTVYRPDEILPAHDTEPRFNFFKRVGSQGTRNVVCVEVAESKDNYEIINWHRLSKESYQQKVRATGRRRAR
jgi:hypothetical protein